MKRKILSVFLALVLCLSLALTVFASDFTIPEMTVPENIAEILSFETPGSLKAIVSDIKAAGGKNTVLYDGANLLTDREESALNENLLSISRKHNAQIVVVTLSGIVNADADEAVEYIYDQVGFGYGENRDGVLLLISMDSRQYRILSNGFAAAAIENKEIDDIGDVIVPNLSDGDYADAFRLFAEQTDHYITGHLTGFPFNTGKSLLISILIGAVMSAVVILVLVGQLKSVRKQSQANVYVKSGSMMLTERKDIFLYRNVTRTKRETSKSSSSGSSRNVGGGSF